MTISQEAIEILQELKQMHQLNYELLEQLSVTCKWMIENNVQSPNISTLCSLLTKTDSLLAEIKADVPKTLVYKKLSRRKVTPSRTDEEETEPVQAIYRGGIEKKSHNRATSPINSRMQQSRRIEQLLFQLQT